VASNYDRYLQPLTDAEVLEVREELSVHPQHEGAVVVDGGSEDEDSKRQELESHSDAAAGTNEGDAEDVDSNTNDGEETSESSASEDSEESI